MKELPMHVPWLSTYNVYGALFSIIGNEEYLPWVHNNFIGLAINHYDDTPYFTDHFSLFEYTNNSSCPWIQVEKPSNKEIIYMYHHIDIIEIIMQATAQERYVWLYLDQYYIPTSDAYTKVHRDHSAIVYGYDENKQIIYLADNLSNGKFIKTTCSYELFEKAWKSEMCHHYRRFLSFLSRKNGSCSVDKEKIATSITDYLNSKNLDTGVFWDNIPIDGPHSYTQNRNYWIFGQKYYEYLNEIIKKNTFIDIRAFHLSLEHKKCMNSRVINLSNDLSLHEGYAQVVERANYLRNLVIKFNITGQETMIGSISSEIDRLVEMERLFLGKFVNELSQSV